MAKQPKGVPEHTCNALSSAQEGNDHVSRCSYCGRETARQKDFYKPRDQ